MEAVTGRKQFYFYELCQLVTAENMVIAYKSRAKSGNWAIWAADNPSMAKLLAEVEISEH